MQVTHHIFCRSKHRQRSPFPFLPIWGTDRPGSSRRVHPSQRRLLRVGPRCTIDSGRGRPRRATGTQWARWPWGRGWARSLDLYFRRGELVHHRTGFSVGGFMDVTPTVVKGMESISKNNLFTFKAQTCQSPAYCLSELFHHLFPHSESGRPFGP